MRKLCFLFVLLAALVVAAPTATAQRPEMGPVLNEDPPVDETCGFPVTTHYTVDREVAKVFANGTILITGRLVAEFSGNGKTITPNISGPGRITFTDDSA